MYRCWLQEHVFRVKPDKDALAKADRLIVEIGDLNGTLAALAPKARVSAERKMNARQRELQALYKTCYLN